MGIKQAPSPHQLCLRDRLPRLPWSTCFRRLGRRLALQVFLRLVIFVHRSQQRSSQLRQAIFPYYNLRGLRRCVVQDAGIFRCMMITCRWNEAFG